jgi:hypothetical protein
MAEYPFHKYIEEQKHLDTDGSRHLIKPIIHIVDKDFKGEEHKFCDKEQLCPLGKYRRPKHIIEAEQRGFKSGLEMFEADKKAEEDKKQNEIDELKEMVKLLMSKLQ